MKRALKLTATAGMAREASEAQKARKRAAQQLDALTKELCAPLSTYVRGFPPPSRLHPFERALLDLTVGTAPYERALARIDALRKGLLELGKGHARRAPPATRRAPRLLTRAPRSYANRATTEREAEQRRKTGCEGAWSFVAACTLRAAPRSHEPARLTRPGGRRVGCVVSPRRRRGGRPERDGQGAARAACG